VVMLLEKAEDKSLDVRGREFTPGYINSILGMAALLGAPARRHTSKRTVNAAIDPQPT